MKVSGAGMGNSLAGLTYYSNNKDDPYITLKEEVHYILLLIPYSGNLLRERIFANQPVLLSEEIFAILNVLASAYMIKTVWIEKYMLFAKLKYSW